MQLRHHPFMSHKGRPIWPPHWSWVSGPDHKLKPVGEVGALENVQGSHVLKGALFLTVAMLDGNRYVGSLNFDNEAFAQNVRSLLYDHVGETLQRIAQIDIT
jgi:hypothetical protein